MEMPEQLEYLVTTVREIKADQKAEAIFHGKIEGAVRVLTILLKLGATGVGALIILAVNDHGTLNALQDKFSKFDPVKVEMKMDRFEGDFTDLKQRVSTLESARIQNEQDTKRRK